MAPIKKLSDQKVGILNHSLTKITCKKTNWGKILHRFEKKTNFEIICFPGWQFFWLSYFISLDKTFWEGTTQEIQL